MGVTHLRGEECIVQSLTRGVPRLCAASVTHEDGYCVAYTRCDDLVRGRGRVRAMARVRVRVSG